MQTIESSMVPGNVQAWGNDPGKRWYVYGSFKTRIKNGIWRSVPRHVPVRFQTALAVAERNRLLIQMMDAIRGGLQ